MYKNINITYNGITSEEIGVSFCRIEVKDYSDVFVSGRTINKETLFMNGKNKTRTYLKSVARSPQHFKVELYSDDMTDDKIREIARWFFQDKYCAFIPSDTGRIYYSMPTGEPKIVKSGNSGYVIFDMECKDEFSYSPTYTNEYDFSGSTSIQTIRILNDGDVEIYPYIEITVIDSNSTITVNNTTNSESFTLGTYTEGLVSYQLSSNEDISIDCNKEIIQSSQEPMVYRYDNFSGSYISLSRGNNIITVNGKCKIKIYTQYKYLV